MATAAGRRVLKLVCHLCAVAALLSIAITAPAITSLVCSGKSLCVPGMSIRCYPSDFGAYYQRCGSRNPLQKVPANKVCYQGALRSKIEEDSTPLEIIEHNDVNNATTTQQACSCDGCSWPVRCSCICNDGGESRVTCRGKVYRNIQVARCCGCNSRSCKPASAWENLEAWVLAQFREVFRGWYLQSVEAAFTFPAPLPLSGCSCTTGKCGNVCG